RRGGACARARWPLDEPPRRELPPPPALPPELLPPPPPEELPPPLEEPPPPPVLPPPVPSMLSAINASSKCWCCSLSPQMKRASFSNRRDDETTTRIHPLFCFCSFTQQIICHVAERTRQRVLEIKLFRFARLSRGAEPA